MEDLPTRAIVRGARLAALPATFVGRRAVGVGRRIGGAPADALAAEIQARTGEQLFTVVGELKGGAMKVGQWLSAMEAALPEDLAGPYGEALTRLQEAAPAMSASMVHQVLASELGRDWRRSFRDFDDIPAAAASIGQVHRAVWRDGREVAVKVQYPRAGEALATDLRQLTRLAPVLRVAAPGLDAHGLLDELSARVMAEVDYRQEAAAQRDFATAFHNDPDFAVPAVIDVADRVLVSEWVGGTPLSVVTRSGDDSQRSRAGLLLTRFLLSSPPRVGRLHGDPHPGNFRLLDDHRLAVIDYGSSLPMPHGWPARLATLLRAAADRNPAALFEVAVATGIIHGSDVSPEALMELVDPFVEPLRQQTFTFSRSWLRAQTTRVSDPRSTASRAQRKLHMPVRHLLVQRVAAGTTGVLCLLGARSLCETRSRHGCPHPFTRTVRSKRAGAAGASVRLT